MRISRWLVAGMVFSPGLILTAQNAPAKQQVQLVAVQYLRDLIDTTVIYSGRTPRLLAPEVLRVTIDGINRKSQVTVGGRSASETADFARILGAEVAVPADTIWCANAGRECHGTRGVQIRLGDPVIAGDSAVMVYSFRARGNDERGLVSRSNDVALFFKLFRGEWRVTHSLHAETATILAVPGPRPPGRSGSGG